MKEFQWQSIFVWITRLMCRKWTTTNYLSNTKYGMNMSTFPKNSQKCKYIGNNKKNKMINGSNPKGKNDQINNNPNMH